MSSAIKQSFDTRLSVAPMMGWTDRHYRMMMRMISPHSLLYTVMITTGAIVHGAIGKHLDYSPEEHPVAMQLGGNDPTDLAKAAKICVDYGYKEINLNCGCPSDRVQRGVFGACLMAHPKLVADCVEAMNEVCAPANVPVTIKTRIGINEQDSYAFLCDFVGTIAERGCDRFIIHARKAWLNGLSPKENRTIPPLDYDRAYQLKKDFPHLQIILNGGLQNWQQIEQALPHCDGVMIGREAFHNPYFFAQLEDKMFGNNRLKTRAEIVQGMVDYGLKLQAEHDFFKLKDIINPMLGLYYNCAGGRLWRRALSDIVTSGAQDPRALLTVCEQIEDFILHKQIA